MDNELEHIGGQGNWGFCRQSCPPLTPVTTTTTTTRRPRPPSNVRGNTPRPRPGSRPTSGKSGKPSPNGVSSHHLLHFVAFFQVASLFSIGVDN